MRTYSAYCTVIHTYQSTVGLQSKLSSPDTTVLTKNVLVYHGQGPITNTCTLELFIIAYCDYRYLQRQHLFI